MGGHSLGQDGEGAVSLTQRVLRGSLLLWGILKGQALLQAEQRPWVRQEHRGLLELQRPESSGGATICSPARLPAPGLWNSPPTTVKGPGTLTLQGEEEEVVRHHVDSTPPPAIPWAPYPHTNTSGPWLPGAAALHCFPAKPGGYSGKPGSIRWGQQLGALAGMGVVSLMHFGLQTFRRVLPFWGCGWRPGKGPHVALRGRLCGGNFCQY